MADSLSGLRAAHRGSVRIEDDDRRQARRRRSGHVHQHQPGDRGGPRRGRRRIEGRHAPRHRRRAPRVRRNRLVHQSRLAPTMPAATARRAGIRTGAASRGAHPRGRLPAGDHPRAAARRTAVRRAEVSGEVDRQLPVGDVARRRVRVGHRCQHHAEGVAGTGRCRRCDRAVELPVRGHHPEDRSGTGNGQHRRPEARTEHPVQRNAIGPAHRREAPTSHREWSTWSPRRTTSSARN